MPNLFKLNLVNEFDNFRSVDMSDVIEGSEGSESCEVGWVCWFRHLGLGEYKKQTGFVLLDVRKLVCWFLSMLCVILLMCAEFI